MSKPLSVTYAGVVYDRTRALYDGRIKIEGIDLQYLETGVEEVFWRQGRYAEFDAAEFSLGAYLAHVERPDCPFVAIPVFPSRAFRHSAIYVRSDSSLTRPADLAGRVIGTPEWSQTASLWMRGILGEHYDLDLRSVKWRTGGVEQPGRQEKSPVQVPGEFDVSPISVDQTLSEQLRTGAIDALITARPPGAFLRQEPWIGRLFDDYRAEEYRFFQGTGIVPIMHLVVIKSSVLADHPWVANNLRLGFESARKLAVPELLDSAVCSSSLIWESAYAQEEAAQLGDVFTYGVDKNRVVLETVLRYAWQQGFTSRLLEPEELFVASTVTDAKF